ncbi:MAG: hypothetical protein ACOY94_16705 [Bacillota bacterium]
MTRTRWLVIGTAVALLAVLALLFLPRKPALTPTIAHEWVVSGEVAGRIEHIEIATHDTYQFTGPPPQWLIRYLPAAARLWPRYPGYKRPTPGVAVVLVKATLKGDWTARDKAVNEVQRFLDFGTYAIGSHNLAWHYDPAQPQISTFQFLFQISDWTTPQALEIHLQGERLRFPITYR